MKIIIITAEEFLVGEAEAINALFEAGLERLHLRKPKSTAAECEALLQGIAPCWHSRIVLHDHLQLAVKYSLGGVHLNSRNSAVPEGFTGSVSTSCHSLEEVAHRKAEYDYLFLSPIFDSVSKQGYNAAFSLEDLSAAADKGIIDGKVIALGGVGAANLPLVRRLGFGGAAVLGNIWQRGAENAVQAYKQLARLQSKLPVALSIAGSDCSGGAGIQADAKTFTALGCYATTAITSVTVQNTMGVKSSHPLEAELVRDQIAAVFEDMPPAAVKIGMCCNEGIAEAISGCLEAYNAKNVVLDPVMLSTSGRRLLDEKAIEVVVNRLMPLCSVITPNLPEAETILGEEIKAGEELQACEKLSRLCKTAVLLKGGHSKGNFSTDFLFTEGKSFKYEGRKINSSNLHGTGCVLSSAIAAALATGQNLPTAVQTAKDFLSAAISLSATRKIGNGNGACLV